MQDWADFKDLPFCKKNKKQINLLDMKEELTGLMHSEFFDDPEERNKVLAVCVAWKIKKGASKNELLQKYGLSEKEYDSIISNIFPNGLPER